MTPQQLLEIAGLPVTKPLIRRLTESKKAVRENVEDNQSEACEEFEEAISQVTDPEIAAAFQAAFEQANQAFRDAYENDDDEGMYSELDTMRRVAEDVREYLDNQSDE